MKFLYGIKKDQTQTFDKQGNRLVVTRINTAPLKIVQIKEEEKDGYSAIQVGVGEKKLKNIKKPTREKLKKAGYKKTGPKYLREIKLEKKAENKIGDEIKIVDIFAEGDKVRVSGVTKGKGFTGVVKRWGFRGGRRTHGSSNERRIGSIGQGTDPGRVWKGKKMPGRMGTAKKTIKGLKIYKINEENNEIWVTGLLPGGRNSLLKIEKEDDK